MSSTVAMFGELYRYRGLLGMLAWRDIRVRYKQSLLGVAWAFLMPLIQTAVMIAIFRYGGMIKIEDEGLGGMPYTLFVLSGIIPWTLFNATIASSMECLTRNSRLVTKIYFPREVFPLANVAGALVDFGIALVVFLPIYAYYAVTDPANVRPGAMLALYPLVVLVQVLFVAGLSMVLSMANLFFRDVKYIMTFVLQLWFFATNVVYPIKFANKPALQWVSYANPMIPVLNAYRDCLQGKWVHTDPWGLACAVGISLFTFFVGWRIFNKAAFKFAEYV